MAADLRWAIAVLAGFALGMVAFGADAAVLVGALIAVVIVLAVRAIMRGRGGRPG